MSRMKIANLGASKKMKSKIQNIVFSEALIERIKNWIKRQPCHVSVSEVVRNAVEKWLAEQEKKNDL